MIKNSYWMPLEVRVQLVDGNRPREGRIMLIVQTRLDPCVMISLQPYKLLLSVECLATCKFFLSFHIKENKKLNFNYELSPNL